MQQIPVSNETRASLQKRRQNGESFDDVIQELLEHVELMHAYAQVNGGGTPP